MAVARVVRTIWAGLSWYCRKLGSFFYQLGIDIKFSADFMLSAFADLFFQLYILLLRLGRLLRPHLMQPALYVYRCVATVLTVCGRALSSMSSAFASFVRGSFHFLGKLFTILQGCVHGIVNHFCTLLKQLGMALFRAGWRLLVKALSTIGSGISWAAGNVGSAYHFASFVLLNAVPLAVRWARWTLHFLRSSYHQIKQIYRAALAQQREAELLRFETDQDIDGFQPDQVDDAPPAYELEETLPAPPPSPTLSPLTAPLPTFETIQELTALVGLPPVEELVEAEGQGSDRPPQVEICAADVAQVEVAAKVEETPLVSDIEEDGPFYEAEERSIIDSFASDDEASTCPSDSSEDIAVVAIEQTAPSVSDDEASTSHINFLDHVAVVAAEQHAAHEHEKRKFAGLRRIYKKTASKA